MIQSITHHSTLCAEIYTYITVNSKIYPRRHLRKYCCSDYLLYMIHKFSMYLSITQKKICILFIRDVSYKFVYPRSSKHYII